jgi:chromosome segregation ATPase
VIIRCDPVDGQQWTDGLQHYSDDGTYCVNNRGQDLVTFVGLLPDKSQRAPVSRSAETESTTAVAGSVSEDPGRIIHNLEQRLEAAKNRNSQALNQLVERDQAINEKSAEIARLQAEWRSEFSAAQQLRSEVQQLEQLLDDARENLRDQEAAARAFDHHCEGMKAAYLAVIKTFVEASR